eukprot:3893262-Amphidinium_carterae.1
MSSMHQAYGQGIEMPCHGNPRCCRSCASTSQYRCCSWQVSASAVVESRSQPTTPRTPFIRAAMAMLGACPLLTALRCCA